MENSALVVVLWVHETELENEAEKYHILSIFTREAVIYPANSSTVTVIECNLSRITVYPSFPGQIRDNKPCSIAV
ncbi:MAG: hypothetical protein IMF14_05090 [Proteobacteria bacterium]|nr:hypothetical protein [Pseudomonadota bacterium]